MAKTYSVKEKVSNNLVEQLLHNRGIISAEERGRFLNPHYENHLHDPFLMPDMEKAVERILFAISKNEKIAIWSDYDADGIPGGALLHDFFKLIGFHNFINYIPDRHLEGYGLNIEGIQRLNEEKIELIITIDCGIRDFKSISLAKELGMEIIITDHHEPAEKLPSAFAIINHKRADSKYPENVLCGTGTIWKLIQAILSKNRFGLALGQEKWLLDLVGIATLSDMVPLTGENRSLAHFGLSVLRKTRRPGLRRLYSMLKIDPARLTEDDLGFLITPRINAASRMGKSRDAFDLLVAADEAEADSKARHLDGINTERKTRVALMVKEIKKMLQSKHENYGIKSVIVLGNPLWRPSLLGLAANSIAEEYNRPVFLWGREGGESIKGSCRSDGSTDLVAIMERAKGAFTEFGGHKFSGGFSLTFDQIETLENSILEASTHTVSRQSEILADIELKIKDVNEGVAKEINRLAPFGVGNEKPVFLFHNIIPERVSRFGKAQEHLSVNLREGSSTARAIGFFTSLDKYNLAEGKSVNLAATMELSYFGGRMETRLRIIDFFN
jgi:single-stranded-DNA-specific exonuclease